MTTVNGKPIESININGRTLINAENMASHGFNVRWEEATRTLYVTRGGSNFSGSSVPANTAKTGTKLGVYYYTDIVTYLDNRVITGYNTNGRTWICAEDMRDYGYNVIWSETDRTLTVINP